jgi:4-carboxymuconolactone decarboxylase
MHIQRYLSAHCFGDHYARRGIDVPTRELLTFSMLVSLGGCEAQVKGHVAANLNVGNDRARLIDVLTPSRSNTLSRPTWSGQSS